MTRSIFSILYSRFIKIMLISLFFISFSTDKAMAWDKLDSLINGFTQKRADRSFENMAYMKAIRLYDKLITNEYTNATIYRNMAKSYYNINMTENAEKYYGFLVVLPDILPEDLYDYAQVLKSNGKYEQADIWIQSYAEINSSDSRAQKQLDTKSKVDDLKSNERYSIEKVSFNSKYSDFGPSMHGDKLLFTSARDDEKVVGLKYAWKEAPYLDLYEIDLDGILTKAEFMDKKLNSVYHDGPGCFSSDGSEFYFTRTNSEFILLTKGEDKVNHLQIFYSKVIEGELEKPVELSFNSKNYSCGHPSISHDGQVLYFTSDMPGGHGGSDIYYVERNGSGWSQPVNLGPEINTEGSEMFPFIHESGELYFASNGHLGLGGLDIYTAKNVAGDKYQVKNMGYPLNSKNDDFSFVLDENMAIGYFASNREGGVGDDDIYKVKVLDKISFNLTLQGVVLDDESGERVEFPRVIMKDSKGNLVRLLSSSENYDFQVEIDMEESYTLDVDNDDYKAAHEKVNPKEIKAVNGVIEFPVRLSRKPIWGIFGNVYLKETMEPFAGVKIHIEDLRNSSTTSYESNDEGGFRIKLEKDSYYKILFEKEGFFAIRADYSTLGKEAGWVNADEFVELTFEKIELNKTIEIPNIYYDLGKWDIRPDAAGELDKVVQFLIDNPTIEIELGSHTDSRGNDQSNQRLSQRRAQSAVDYIVNKGIENSRITAMGYGETKLKNRCADGVSCSEVEHQENRRTEIRITGI